MAYRMLCKPALLAIVAALSLSACGKDGKPGDAQPVPKAEAPIPVPTPVTAASAPDAAADAGAAASTPPAK
jgi:hypothetical protein